MPHKTCGKYTFLKTGRKSLLTPASQGVKSKGCSGCIAVVFIQPVPNLSDYQYAHYKRKCYKILIWMLMDGGNNLMTIRMETAEALTA